MAIMDAILLEFEHESAGTRKLLVRLPEAELGWKPHEKSMNALSMATHVANLLSWGAMILTTEELDFASEEAQNWKPPTANNAAEVLAILDQNVSQVKAILAGMSDEDLQKTWTMRAGEQIYAADSRAFAFTRWVLSHQSHHRGQLMVYLRMNDVPVPGIFGPSADETEM